MAICGKNWTKRKVAVIMDATALLASAHVQVIVQIVLHLLLVQVAVIAVVADVVQIAIRLVLPTVQVIVAMVVVADVVQIVIKLVLPIVQVIVAMAVLQTVEVVALIHVKRGAVANAIGHAGGLATNNVQLVV